MGNLFDERFAEQDIEESEWSDEASLPPELVAPMHDLLQLGELHDEFEYLGHTFHIRTMRIGEELAALSAIKGYQDVPLAQGRAYATAMVAGAIVSVDSRAVIQELSPSERTTAVQKFNKISQWHYPIIDYVYKRYTALEKKQDKILKELQARLVPDENADESVEELSESSV